jgi:hypothetical protein
MSEPRPLVDNYADAGQVREAKRVEKSRALRHENDLRVVLAMPEGRRCVFRILGQFGVSGTLFDENALRMAANVGAWERANEIIREIHAAAPEAMEMMQAEHRKETAKQ